MSLQQILQKVQAESGVSSPDTDQEALLINKINQACEEIYNEKDLPVALKEVYIKATSDYRLALPPFVGEIRAIRSQVYNDRWVLHDLRPRYTVNDWPEKWNRGRLIGEFPIATTITNSAPGFIEYPVADESVIITIVGETADSNRGIDGVALTSTSVQWNKNFSDIRTIRKNKTTDYNVIIKDADLNEIAIIYADQLESRYLILDISSYPLIQECSDGSFVMEVLYKPRLPRLEHYEDSFPLQGYDDIIALRTMQLLLEDQEGKEQLALLKYQKSKLLLDQKNEDKTGTVQHKMTYKKDPLLGIYRRGFWPGRNNYY